jgi:hypothetical protein
VDAADQTAHIEGIKDVSSVKPVIIPVGLFPLTSSEGTLFMFHEKVIRNRKRFHNTIQSMHKGKVTQCKIKSSKESLPSCVLAFQSCFK